MLIIFGYDLIQLLLPYMYMLITRAALGIGKVTPKMVNWLVG